MLAAMRQAGVDPSEVDYINAHGTSTPPGDVAETKAIKVAFGEHARAVAVSSSKSMIGHLLGGSGGVEAVVTVRTIVDGRIHPTINLTDPDPECDLDYVPGTAREADVRVAASNSFGFGGHNVTLVFRRFEADGRHGRDTPGAPGPIAPPDAAPSAARGPTPSRSGATCRSVRTAVTTCASARASGSCSSPTELVLRALEPPAARRPARVRRPDAVRGAHPRGAGDERHDRGDARRHGGHRRRALRAGGHGLRLHGRQHGQRGGREVLARDRDGRASDGLPLVFVATSGGARMQEGILSLMQMAKTTLRRGRS